MDLSSVEEACFTIDMGFMWPYLEFLSKIPFVPSPRDSGIMKRWNIPEFLVRSRNLEYSLISEFPFHNSRISEPGILEYYNMLYVVQGFGVCGMGLGYELRGFGVWGVGFCCFAVVVHGVWGFKVCGMGCRVLGYVVWGVGCGFWGMGYVVWPLNSTPMQETERGRERET